MLCIANNIIDSTSDKAVYPDQVVVLGGGRWARVITSVLCDFLPDDIPITMCSPRGYLGLLEWASNKNVGGRVLIQGQWPETFTLGSTAVIVANAASDHAKAGHWALDRNAAVLVEKPLAMSSQEVFEICNYARSSEGILAAAHVLRFNRYLRNFSDVLPRLEQIISIRVEWVDTAGEYRYGDTKQYDPAVPVYVDCLPHVVSVLQSLFDVLPVFDKSTTIESAGAKVVLVLSLAGRPCCVVMQRNGNDRVRRVVVESAGRIAVLDFSTEPGVIKLGSDEFCADPFWDTAPRPLFSMLQAFLIAASGAKIDQRLSLDTALAAASIAEQVTPVYQSTVVPWLVERLKSSQDIDDAIWYAVSEILRLNLRQVAGKSNATELLKLLRKRLRLSEINTSTPQSTAEHILHLFRDEIAPDLA